MPHNPTLMERGEINERATEYQHVPSAIKLGIRSRFTSGYVTQYNGSKRSGRPKPESWWYVAGYMGGLAEISNCNLLR